MKNKSPKGMAAAILRDMVYSLLDGGVKKHDVVAALNTLTAKPPAMRGQRDWKPASVREAWTTEFYAAVSRLRLNEGTAERRKKPALFF
jgi:hypothetical protein